MFYGIFRVCEENIYLIITHTHDAHDMFALYSAASRQFFSIRFTYVYM